MDTWHVVVFFFFFSGSDLYDTCGLCARACFFAGSDLYATALLHKRLATAKVVSVDDRLDCDLSDVYSIPFLWWGHDTAARVWRYCHDRGAPALDGCLLRLSLEDLAICSPLCLLPQ